MVKLRPWQTECVQKTLNWYHAFPPLIHHHTRKETAEVDIDRELCCYWQRTRSSLGFVVVIIFFLVSSFRFDLQFGFNPTHALTSWHP